MRSWGMQRRKFGRVLGTVILGAVAVLSFVFVSGAARPRSNGESDRSSGASRVARRSS